MNKHRITTLVLLLTTCLLTACHTNKPTASQKSPASDWQLDTQNSQLSFITTKNKVITEEHSIDFAAGQIDTDNRVDLTLDLHSLNTGIPIRDERMKNILFEVDAHPTISINTQLSSAPQTGAVQSIELQVSIKGIEQSMQTQAMVQRVGPDLLVTSYQPIRVNAKTFGLDAGVNQLTKLAGLQSINYDITAEYKLHFKPKSTHTSRQ